VFLSSVTAEEYFKKWFRNDESRYQQKPASFSAIIGVER